MNLGNLGVALCLAAAMTGIAYAGDHRRESQNDRHHGSTMQALTVAAKAGEPADDAAKADETKPDAAAPADDAAKVDETKPGADKPAGE